MAEKAFLCIFCEDLFSLKHRPEHALKLFRKPVADISVGIGKSQNEAQQLYAHFPAAQIAEQSHHSEGLLVQRLLHHTVNKIHGI